MTLIGVPNLMANFNLKVILVVNSRPALNDVTINELHVLLEQVSRISPEIERYVTQGQLIPFENGSGSPCLNLKSVSQHY